MPSVDHEAEAHAIARLWRADEPECVPPLIVAAQLDEAQRERSALLARALIEGMRRHQSGRGVEAITAAFPLNSAAGLALLSLAEALLRVPDAANADRLVRDRLSRVDWGEHRSSGALGAALRLASACVSPPDSSGTRAFRLDWRSLTTPLVRTAMQISIRSLSDQFIFGHNIQAALARAGRADGRAYRYSFDMLGEAALTAHDAQRYFLAYRQAIHAVGGAYRGQGPLAGGSVSVKLSALHPRYIYTQHERIMRELLPRLFELARLAQHYDIALVIDAEEADRLEPSLDLIEALMCAPELADWAGLGVAVQAYQKRAPAVIDYLLQLAARRRARLHGAAGQGRLLGRGNQVGADGGRGRLSGVHPQGLHRCRLPGVRAPPAGSARAGGCRSLRPTTLRASRPSVRWRRPKARPSTSFNACMAWGPVYTGNCCRCPGSPDPVRIYAPVGTRATLLAYLMRRLIENGAAASFVHRAAAAGTPLPSLWADPTLAAARYAGAPNPRIALPSDLFAPERRNSSGVDLADAAVRASLTAAIEHDSQPMIEVQPLVAGASAAGTAAASGDLRREIRNPADLNQLIGSVLDAADGVVDAAIAAAIDGAPGWAETEIEQRAQILERAAQLYQQQLPALVALAVREAGKTLANGVGEVREAVDFLRYYAAQIRTQFDHATHLPLGAVVCISPWNFPLAIFTGQVAAALAAGNTVLAKPAEQSSAMAARAVQLLHQAGVPRAVLQLLPGDGERVGARLVADARIGGSGVHRLDRRGALDRAHPGAARAGAADRRDRRAERDDRGFHRAAGTGGR